MKALEVLPGRVSFHLFEPKVGALRARTGEWSRPQGTPGRGIHAGPASGQPTQATQLDWQT
jgi:hypothetical protein